MRLWSKGLGLAAVAILSVDRYIQLLGSTRTTACEDVPLGLVSLL
jgi:hypothetical protein